MYYSASHSQDEILNSISSLYLPAGRVQLDVCYNKGGFYRSGHVQSPEIKNDLFIRAPGLENFDVRYMPYSDETIVSIVFDPPFLVGPEDNKMIKRYGGFSSIEDMFYFQDDSIREIARVLKKGGFLIAKTQDFTHGRQKYFTALYQVQVCRHNKLHLIDSFILVNRNRLRSKNGKQSSSVSAHCFFNVYQKQSRVQRVKRY